MYNNRNYYQSSVRGGEGRGSEFNNSRGYPGAMVNNQLQLQPTNPQQLGYNNNPSPSSLVNDGISMMENKVADYVERVDGMRMEINALQQRQQQQQPRVREGVPAEDGERFRKLAERVRILELESASQKEKEAAEIRKLKQQNHASQQEAMKGKLARFQSDPVTGYYSSNKKDLRTTCEKMNQKDAERQKELIDDDPFIRKNNRAPPVAPVKKPVNVVSSSKNTTKFSSKNNDKKSKDCSKRKRTVLSSSDDDKEEQPCSSGAAVAVAEDLGLTLSSDEEPEADVDEQQEQTTVDTEKAKLLEDNRKLKRELLDMRATAVQHPEPKEKGYFKKNTTGPIYYDAKAREVEERNAAEKADMEQGKTQVIAVRESRNESEEDEELN